MAEYENNSGTVSSDIERGAQKTISAGRSVARAGKAVGRAATGDFVGAAAEAAQSEGVRRFIAILLCASLLLTILIFFAAPLAIYEGVKAYFDTLKERWLEEYYGANTNRILAALKATFSGAWDIIQDFFNTTIAAITQNDSGQKDTDNMTSDDITVMGLTDSLANVYSKKMDACINKIGFRSAMIENAIYASANGSISNTGTINGWIYNYLYSARDYWTYANLEDTRYVNYAGVTVTSGSQTMTRREAMKVIALYSAMYNCDVDLIQPYALMKWLGYYDGTAATPMNFVVGDAVTCTVKGWQGEFMPMYLIEESMENETGDYSRYMCPAADILLVVTSDPLASLTPHVEKTEIRRIEYEQRWEYGPQWRLMSEDTYNSWSSYYYDHGISYLSEAGTVPYCDYYYQLLNYYRGDLSYYGMVDAYTSGELDWYVVYDYYTYWEEIEIIEYDYTLSYAMNASVSLRSADTISKVAGFYEKEDSAA